MKFNAFMALDYLQKEATVRQLGTLFDEFDDGFIPFEIYCLFDFYVGLYYLRPNRNEPNIIANLSLNNLPWIEKTTRFTRNLDCIE